MAFWINKSKSGIFKRCSALLFSAIGRQHENSQSYNIKPAHMKHTPSPWSGTRETELGTTIVLSSTGIPICEVLFTDGLGSDNKIREESKANELLIRQAPSMKKELELVVANLKNLRTGKLSIFDFPIAEHIKDIENVLSKTEEP